MGENDHTDKEGKYLRALEAEVMKILGDEPSHGIEHARRTMELAEAIALQEGGDRPTLKAAALLHDIGRRGIFADPGHGKRGADMALEILARIGAPWDREKIAELILHHDDPGDDGPIDLVILKDADRLELFRVFPGYLDLERLATDTALLLVPYALRFHEKDEEIFRKEAQKAIERSCEILADRRRKRTSV